MRVLICGGGVIGVSIAFFLSRAGAEVIVVERTGIACAASGKSGGFLALDWCDGSPVEALARRSFALHAELAQTLNENWGYRRLDTLNVIASARRSVEAWRNRASPVWLAPEAAVHARLGTRDTTAQIDPAAFTRALLRAALVMGAELRIDTVTGVALNRDGSAARGAVVDGRMMEGRCARHRHGSLVRAGAPVVAAAACPRAEEPQPRPWLRAAGWTRGPVCRTRDGRRRSGVAGGGSAPRRDGPGSVAFRAQHRFPKIRRTSVQTTAPSRSFVPWPAGLHRDSPMPRSWHPRRATGRSSGMACR